jgi:glycosidase
MPMSMLQEQYTRARLAFRDTSTLGVFLDNHDLGRIYHLVSQGRDSEERKAVVLNMLTFIYMSYGIPIFYYGTEALLSGAEDPLNREPFYPLGKDKANLDKVIIKYIKTLNKVRKGL